MIKYSLDTVAPDKLKFEVLFVDKAVMDLLREGEIFTNVGVKFIPGQHLALGPIERTTGYPGYIKGLNSAYDTLKTQRNGGVKPKTIVSIPSSKDRVIYAEGLFKAIWDLTARARRRIIGGGVGNPTFIVLR